MTAARKIALLVLVSFALGCGGNKDKGINKDKDRPRSSAQPASNQQGAGMPSIQTRAIDN